MAHYQYRARNAEGQLFEGLIEAASAGVVAGQLQAGGILPLTIDEVAAPLIKGQKKGFSLGRAPRVGRDDLILFCRQMFTLTKSGVPLVRAIRGLVETARNPTLGQALGQVVDSLEAGQDLAGAFSAHPRVFPGLFCRLVQVGENTGKLDEVFRQLSTFYEHEKDTVNRIKQALRYPTFVLIAIVCAVIFISLFVIPAFQKVFASFGAELPLATRILLGLSGFMLHYWPLLLILAIMLVAALKQLLNTHQGRYAWDRYKLKIPLVGDIILRGTLVRFSRAFNMSFGAGVPLTQALSFTARGLDNLFVGEKVELIRNGVERGDTLTRSATQTGLFTPLVLQMLAVGEETGSVDTMLEDVAEFYEREVEYDIKNLSSAIEPLMIIIIGGMVLVLALGVFLPMWNLAAVVK
ncbi:type II secretion system F family protein [Geopsychrobacter electrodiphilus]|uniref:type II secretion system F family protein n=1 Tax=Geopsychrobacter electrodiphilus TaxID=225196 RepID=UPI0003664330|nr:type II secretion system F family protein [Geopsychrobacter electrodiphilus]